MFNTKYDKLIEKIDRLRSRYEAEIHNRDMSIHQSIMNQINKKGTTLFHSRRS